MNAISAVVAVAALKKRRPNAFRIFRCRWRSRRSSGSPCCSWLPPGPLTGLPAIRCVVVASQASTSVLPDLGPDVYTKWRASSIGSITEQLQRRLILTLLGEIRGRNVLDVGCGDGDFAVELWRRGASVTGIDASQEMIE